MIWVSSYISWTFRENYSFCLTNRWQKRLFITDTHERNIIWCCEILKNKLWLTNPSAEPSNNIFPFFSVPCDNFPALCIVITNSHFHDIIWTLDIESFVNFKLDRQTVTVPSETPFDVVTLLVRIPGDDVFDGTGQYVTIMWQTGGERRSVVKGESKNTTLLYAFNPNIRVTYFGLPLEFFKHVLNASIFFQ